VTGFTLLEVMLATFITAFVFAGVMSAYMFLGRSLARQVNEQSLESRTRLALYWLTQDASSASAIYIQNPGATTTGYQMVLSVPSLGSVYYSCDWSGGANMGKLTRQVGSGPVLTLLTNLTSFDFGYYDIDGNPVAAPGTASPLTAPTTLQLNVKQVCMYYTSTAGVASTGDQSNLSIASPLIIMKNQGYLTDPNVP
jgi:type II secretory pathway pseudopilin PulG